MTLRLWILETGDAIYEAEFAGTAEDAAELAQREADNACCAFQWELVDESGEVVDSGAVESGVVP